MKQWMTEMNAWLDEEIVQCEARRDALKADGREDEAAFEQIRSNVYEIFRTVLFAAGRAGGDERAFFAGKLDGIPKRWVESYEEGKRHGDVPRMVIESMRLDTVRKIRGKLEALGEEDA